ncbi:elongation of very long chain fatty acids protein 4-like isoform X2 [Pollicipes pollicipes]|nr:elongation of very long chain fatty acids protein 4-like isoform X2 [Pollicipes pollicipes]
MAVTSYSVLSFATYTYNSVSFKFAVAYLLLVSASRLWKQNTKPIHLSKLMSAYNYAMALANAICCGMFLMALFKCDKFFSKARDPRVETASLLYWLLKIAELLDTVFMLLRHKTNQISVLHVYHHTSMVLLTDYFYHLAPWPAISFPVMVNAFVHVCLYTYYGMTSSSISVPLQWKRRMTQLQIAQFAVGLAHATLGYLRHGFCGYSILYAITMIVLFGNFYVQAYVREKKPKKKAV